MDMINEQKSSAFDDFVDVAHTNDVNEVSEDGEAADDSFSESPSDVSEDDLTSDFAKQLKERRKQVIHGVKQKEDFSQKLRKHRETLVETWVHHHDGSETKSTVLSEEQNGQSAGVNDLAPAVTEELDVYDFGDFPAPSMEVGAEVDDDDDFGDFDAAPPVSDTQQPQTKETLDDSGDFAAPTEAIETPGTENYAHDDLADDITSEVQQSQPLNEIDDGSEVVHIVDAVAVSPESPEPVEQQASDVDEFGDFGVAPSEPQNEETLTPVSGQAGFFGGLGTASASESQQSLPIDEQEEVSADEFGGFGGAPAEPQAEAPTQNGDGADFGDFETPSASEPQQGCPDNEIGGFSADEFGGFGGAPAEPQAEAPTQNGDGADFGDFETPSASEPQQGCPDNEIGGLQEAPTAPLTEAAAKEEDADEFGDFGPASVSEPQQFQPVEKQEVAADEDFGDFGAAPTEHPSDNTTQETGVDDFGDFGEGQESSQQEDGDGYDFGDFRAASSGPELSVSKEAESVDDDFGDFGAASAPVAQNDEDEDFSDFGAPVVAENQAENDDDDEFGDFGDAGTDLRPSEPSAVNPLDGEDDDFGDFGAAPSTPPGETKPSYGEDDEFGDFDEADESKAEHKAGEEFGDFSDFNEADAQAAQPPAPTPSHQEAPPLNTGPQFERAKLVFSKIQGGYSFDLIEIKDANSSDDQVTLKSFIASLNYKDPAETEEGNRIVLSTLKDCQNHKESHSKVIISQDGRGPYSHFISPIGGSVAPIDKIGTDRVKKRGSVVGSYVPEVLSIQLPTGNESAVEMASPTPGRPKVNGSILSSKTGTGESNEFKEVTPAKTSSSTEQGLSEAAKELLRKIPDLSFMLNTTLSLPKK